MPLTPESISQSTCAFIDSYLISPFSSKGVVTGGITPERLIVVISLVLKIYRSGFGDTTSASESRSCQSDRSPASEKVYGLDVL